MLKHRAMQTKATYAASIGACAGRLCLGSPPLQGLGTVNCVTPKLQYSQQDLQKNLSHLITVHSNNFYAKYVMLVLFNGSELYFLSVYWSSIRYG